MILLVQPDFERLQRIWLSKLVKAWPPLTPTNKSILSLYVSTVDRIIRLDKGQMQKAIESALVHDRCLKDDVIDALGRAKKQGIIPKGRLARTATHILENLVARMHYQAQAADRVRVDQDALEVLNFLNGWFRSQREDHRKEQVGGAPAIIAQVLTELREPNVVLWTAYHSQNQAKVFNTKMKFLVIDELGNLLPLPIRDVRKPEDPEVRNYPIEFAQGTEFVLEKGDGTTVSIAASNSDRVIAISPGYRFFDDDGYVDKTITPADIAHILAHDPQHGPSHVAEVAKEYKYWIIGGLHKVEEQACQGTLESDLRLVPPDVSIHVEIPGPDISPWFQQVLRRYVHSVGVNIDDIEQLVQKTSSNEPPRTNPPPPSSTPDIREEYLLRLALWLACEFDLERIYVHGLELDYIVRRIDASDDDIDHEMDQEVHADLLAKAVVANRARSVGIVSQPPDQYGLPARNLIALIEVCFLRAYPTQPQGWITFEDLPAFKPILDRGWFKDTFNYQGQQVDYRVAIVPVALFRIDPGGLKFVGAGDASSAVSFVFGYHAP
jgi:ADP-dependent phosphofructokinase/glucokinase